MSNWKSLVGGVVIGMAVAFAAPLRAEPIPVYLDELKRIANALEKANDLSREQSRAIENVAREVGDIECGR